jgi:hypothetical protein
MGPGRTPMIPNNQHVEIRDGRYYIGGARIGLDVVAYGFRNGKSPKMSLGVPSVGSIAKVYGTITFILEHPVEVDAYLKDQERILEEYKRGTQCRWT